MTWKIKPIYAMSPDQYEQLRVMVADKKIRLRKMVEAVNSSSNWAVRARPIGLLNLPPLQPGLPLPQYSDKEKKVYRLPDFLFNRLARDQHNGN
jgi:hypothetical protein